MVNTKIMKPDKVNMLYYAYPKILGSYNRENKDFSRLGCDVLCSTSLYTKLLSVTSQNFICM